MRSQYFLNKPSRMQAAPSCSRASTFEHTGEDAIFDFGDVVKNIVDLCYLAGQPPDFSFDSLGIISDHEWYYFARMPSCRKISISPSRGVPVGCRFSLAVSAVSSFVPV
jgi:hypothetical protein